MKQSIVMISPAEAVPDANALCVALGWGSDNFLIALSADGTGPATHFGLRASESQSFVAALSEAVEADVSLNDVLTVDTRTDTNRALHFETITAETGLQRVAMPVDV